MTNKIKKFNRSVRRGASKIGKRVRKSLQDYKDFQSRHTIGKKITEKRIKVSKRINKFSKKPKVKKFVKRARRTRNRIENHFEQQLRDIG